MRDKPDLVLRRLDSIDALLDRHDQRFDSMEALLRSHADLLTQLIASDGVANERISEIQTDLALINEGQAQRDRVLESPALRSLEQETELREIRRVRQRLPARSRTTRTHDPTLWRD